MYSKLLNCFLIAFLFGFVKAIDLKPIRVPSVVLEGSNVYLECKFDLEGFNLHSVKWRKNRGLFYKYQPHGDPHGIKRSYPIQGVNVNLRYSNETHVFLENVDFNTQGTYSCDVISNDPFPKEVSSEDRLSVVHSDFLFTPLGSTGPRLQRVIENNPKHLHIENTHSDVHLGSQGSVIISPETEKEKTVTTTLKKSSTLLSHNHNGPALNHGELEHVRSRISNTIDLTKLKNLNYDQHQDYVERDGSRLHFDQTSSKRIKTVNSDYFPIELGPSRVIHTDIPNEHKVTTIRKTVLSPKQNNDETILNQKIRLVDHHPPAVHNPHHPHDKSARYEVEEDGIVFNGDSHHHHPNEGQVKPISPEQYNAREDVVLFKPVSNHSFSSTAFNNRQLSWILFNLTISLILIVNIFVKKF